MGLMMRGAEMTFPSRMMANNLPTFSDVTSPNLCPPRILKRKLTIGSCVRGSKPGWASVKSSPCTMTRFSTGNNLPGCSTSSKEFDIGGIGARFGDKAEFELGRRSQEFP